MRRGLLITLALLLALPASALAHATLEASTPARGAVARTQPAQVVLRFDEPVEGNFGAVRLFDARGERVDDGHVVHPGGRGALLAVGLKPRLAPGTFTATYRVISADSHPVSGGFVFSIGKAGAAPAQTVGDLLGGSSAGRVTEVAFGVARGADYLAIALLLGTLLFGLLAWGPGAAAAGAPDAAGTAFARRSGKLLIAGLGIGLVAGAAGIVLQGATAAGTSFWSALDPGTVREVLGTRFGTVWGLRLADLAVLGAVLATFGPRRPLAWALPAALLAITPALGGHATTQHPVALLAPLDVAHVVAMSAWIGGLVVLLVAVPAATRAVPPAARSVLLGGVVSRFSTVALAAVATLLATGVAQSIVHLRAFDDLLHTAFGRAVLIKVVLVAALVGLGAVNRQRSIPRLRALAREGAAPGVAGRLLRSTLRAEVALVVVALGVTAALVSYAPPSALSAGPFSHSARTGPLQVELTVDPARTGANAVHLYLFRASDGAPFAGTKELTVDASLPDKGIGPLMATVHRAGPGHYVADAMVLAPAGHWRLRVTDRVSDFDEYTTTFAVPVR
ncbi:MAG TPA: copper resistance protein CopC [Baekduia sp.]|uniref:copper resistance CopC/CopD family protein n=1 Tax=Baekduia sp. TaxID=2600305 RepID=UPI002BDB29E3|nr:copper resistance protein CopC [Baekduia sp.]HMJ35559.1 copper resistance protein CopC [Baekduia sp.]